MKYLKDNCGQVKKIMIISVSVMVLIAAVISGFLFDWKKENKAISSNICRICEVRVSVNDEHCLDCIRRYQCYECAKVTKAASEGICNECKR